jgi:2-succinyl-6-hydroxy-2,4-cyclohexadiene-1-carboxylate synthase
MGTGADWLPITDHLSHRFFCIMPDLPGHGKNTIFPISQPLNFDIISAGLVNLLDQLELDEVSLVGYSMGGRLGLYTALKYPTKIKSLVIESASPGLATKQERQERAALDDRQAERLLAGGFDAFIEAWYNLPLFETLHRYPQLLEAVKKTRKKNNPDWMAKIISELSPGRQPALWKQLATLAMPVLLMAGALDKKYAKLIMSMGQKIPHVVTHIIPDTGHNIHLEQPAQFVKLIDNFFRQKFTG